MLVPFGTRVVDEGGRSVGTVSRLILHPGTREVAALVVHQGIVDRREVVVPLGQVASWAGDVRLRLRAPALDGLDLFHAPSFKDMPDQWEMPVGFDQREFFLVGGDGWTEATLPFEKTSPDVSGTPRVVPDPDAPAEAPEPDIATGTDVLDKAGRRIGEVDGVEIDPASRRITRITVRRGVLFGTETAIPASMIASVAPDRITLRVAADALRRFERA